MQAKLIHKLTYNYPSLVKLGEHRLCLKPKNLEFQNLLEFRLNINPKPIHIYPFVAKTGDQVHRAKFTGFTNLLEIEAISIVKTKKQPMLQRWMLDSIKLPYPKDQLSSELVGALSGSLPNGDYDPASIQLSLEAMNSTQQGALAFIERLIGMIQDRIEYTERDQGAPWPPGKTLRRKLGSCRDLAILMMECCRCVGLPARFTSGYHLVEPAPKKYNLHAWTEVYLPGAGWKSFDASGAGAIDERYITLATSSKSELAAAVSGTFTGPVGIKSKLNWTIDVILQQSCIHKKNHT